MRSSSLIPIFLFLYLLKGFAANAAVYDLSIEWLYMLFGYDQPYFGIVQGGLPHEDHFDGNRLANKQSWQMGYRLEAQFQFPCNTDYINLRWTHFPSFSTSRDVDETFLGILNIPHHSAVQSRLGHIRDRFSLYYFDGFFGFPFYQKRGRRLDFLVGVQSVNLSWKEKVRYAGGETGIEFIYDMEYRSKMKGIGPEFALDFLYALSPCWNVTGRALTALIVNKREASLKDTQTTAEVFNQLEGNTNQDEYWLATPMLNSRLGLNCICSCLCMNLCFEIGYEVLSYFKSVDRVYFVDVFNVGSSTIQHMDFILHGPYARLDLCF